MKFVPAKAFVVASEISGDRCRLLLPPLPGRKSLLPLILHSRGSTLGGHARLSALREPGGHGWACRGVWCQDWRQYAADLKAAAGCGWNVNPCTNGILQAQRGASAIDHGAALETRLSCLPKKEQFMVFRVPSMAETLG
jgi:hypothetical protein